MAKRRVLLIYGEKTTQINFRVPESKKEKIIKEVDELLKKYHDPKHVSIDVKDSASKKSVIEIPDEVGQFIGHKNKDEKPQKKIEPQVVEEELDEEDLLYNEYEKLEGTFEVLEKMPIVCNKTDVSENGHNIWTDNKSFYVREKNGAFNKWTKFDRIEFAVFYIQDNLIRKN
jgi:hypothetical protein